MDALADAVSAGPTVAYIEDVPTFIAPASKPIHSKLGRQFGFWEGICAASGVPVRLVKPQKWQKGIAGVDGKTGMDRKRALCAEARRIFPMHKITLDNCDAVLLADYARRMERGSQ